MRVHNRHFERVQLALAASVLALLAAAPVLAAEPAEPAASRYVPTMEDYLSIYDALHRYRMGTDKRDQKLRDSAYWEAPAPGRPPPGLAPRPDSNAGPASPGGGGGATPAAVGTTDLWHLPLDSYIHFESATRATHYGYFLSIYPQPEKKSSDPAIQLTAAASRHSIVGWPGHYDDILEKRNGEWRILQRKVKINEK